MEKAEIALDRDDPSPAELRGYFADVFVSLDERPRPVMLSLSTWNDRGTRFSISLKNGEPVFNADDGRSAKADFRGRWLGMHPSPLELPFLGSAHLVLEPAGGNRVAVRRPTLFERIFG